MDTVQNNEFLPPVAALRIRYSHVYTENIPFMTEDAFLNTLTDVLDTQGLNAVAAVNVFDESDLSLRYRVHEILVGEYGISAIPERYWRLSLKDHAFMDKLESLMTFEEAERLENRVTQFIPDCERNAVIVESLASRLSDETLLELVDAFYEGMPASYRTADREKSI